MPEACCKRDQLALMSDGHGCTWKSALVDAGAKDVKRTPELFVLMLERMGQRAVGILVQEILSCCFCFGL